MRSSVVRWVQIIPRKVLQLPEKKITLPPAPETRNLKVPTLVDVLMQQKEASGELWPTNIRIEPLVKKEAFKHVQSDVRKGLRKLLKER